MRRIPIDRETLRILVEDEKLQHWRIAEILETSRDTIVRRCREFGLKTEKTGPRRGEGHPGWKGGVSYMKGYRYLYVPDHPNCTRHGRVAEHRLVMEKKLGRYLDRKEVVHHLDGNILNNSPDNLGIFQNNATHLATTLKGQIPNWTEDGKRRIAEGCLQAYETGRLHTTNGLLALVTGDHRPPQSPDHQT